ncbi:putative protease related to collagenase [Desulfovibrio sp. DV]|uniref:hypothetical protein n=1 Tax=Desulfovibrio sp. DV TaxID=1844708 RepID=UPI00094BA533|nr:hypothetical protein [Desulfovibrio sp. DV]OLN28834.1 putative protease related to collagenase [Desulfovibrio sp. DV]
MRFEVPFVPEAAYASLVAGQARALEAVYFRLGPETPDARLPGLADPSPMELAAGLAALPDIPRLGLLNAAFHAPDLLIGDGLRDLVMLLDGYLAAGAVTGIIYADQYLLQALSDASPEVAGALCAIPSINFRLDSLERASAIIEAAGSTRFRPPPSVILDRDSNRRPGHLAAITQGLHRQWPGIRVGVMANEGCLYACPYKTAHDAHIALSRLAACRVGPDINRDLGCLRRFAEDPGRMLASPFIRPEDVGRLEGVVDFVKVCGRSRTARDLRTIVSAYLAGRYDGNLLWLLDTLEILSDRFTCDNAALPEDFFARTADCSRQCRVCGYCRTLADRLVSRRDPALPRYTPD